MAIWYADAWYFSKFEVGLSALKNASNLGNADSDRLALAEFENIPTCIANSYISFNLEIAGRIASQAASSVAFPGDEIAFKIE